MSKPSTFEENIAALRREIERLQEMVNRLEAEVICIRAWRDKP
jgi:ubiquinone biosynthesis protein UbiJ